MSTRTGQMFTTDMLVSAFVFIVILNVSYMAINEAYSQQDSFSKERIMQQQSSYIANLLVRTAGYPDGWTAENTSILGISDPDHTIQQRLLRELNTLNRSTFRRVLDLSDTNASINVTHKNRTVTLPPLGDGDVAYFTNHSKDTYLDPLNDSSITWDLYSVGNAPTTTARDTYTDTDGAALFEDLVANSSNYSLIVAENPNIGQSDISNENTLSRFVQDGGIYWQDGTGTIMDLFSGARTTVSGDQTGDVTAGRVLNPGLENGDSVTIQEGAYSFGDADTFYVNKTGTDTCLACHWNSGDGRVYYFTNTSVTSVSQTNNVLKTANLTDLSAVAGMDLFWGDPADTAEDVAASRRAALVNATNLYQRATVTVVIWK